MKDSEMADWYPTPFTSQCTNPWVPELCLCDKWGLAAGPKAEVTEPCPGCGRTIEETRAYYNKLLGRKT